MKRCKSLVALMLALTAASAKAQFVENFNGARLSPGWDFNAWYVGGAGGYEALQDYTVGGGQFVITGRQGVLRQYFTNVPSIAVNAGAPTDYDIKVTAQGSYDYPTTAIAASFGLLIFANQDNYFTFQTSHGGANNIQGATPAILNVNFIDTTLEIGAAAGPGSHYDGFVGLNDNTFSDYLSDANYNNQPNFDPATPNPAVAVGANPVTYHINKTGTTITLSYAIGGGAEKTLTTFTSADTDPYKSNAYTLLSDLSGKHIGLFNAPGYNGGSFAEPVAFSKFNTTLPTSGISPKFDESFSNETKFSSAFSFNVDGNFPTNTEDATHYSFGIDSLGRQAYKSVLQPGLLQGLAAKNLPNVTIGTGNTGDWYLEASIYAPFSTVHTYPSAALVLFTDANNFAMFKDQNVGFTDGPFAFGNTAWPLPGTQYLSALLYTGGNYQDDVFTNAFIVGPTVIRIKKTAGLTAADDAYDISFESNDDNYQNDKFRHNYLDKTVTGGQLDLFNFLENIDGKHIGLFANANGYADPADTVSFYDLKTSLNIVQGATGATVSGNIALEGVSDLSATSAAAPLGTFNIQFRTPRTLTVVKEFPAVTLIKTTGSANGKFSVSGIPAGTYDVWIKGGKNLAVLNPNVVVSATTGTVPDSLLGAGDSDNNNTVDVLDFGNLVNAYGSKASDPNSGYDPNVDFDFNGAVDVLDFGDLVNEYGVSGPK